jgi:hypothetical protein
MEFVGQTIPHPESRILTLADLQAELGSAMSLGDEARQTQVHELIATVYRRYSFSGAGTGRELLQSHQMFRFEDWLRYRWANQPVTN